MSMLRMFPGAPRDAQMIEVVSESGDRERQCTDVRDWLPPRAHKLLGELRTKERNLMVAVHALEDIPDGTIHRCRANLNTARNDFANKQRMLRVPDDHPD